MKIAIKSYVKLMFPPANFGYVRIEIDLAQNKPGQDEYELRLIDSCFDVVEGKEVNLGIEITRFKTYSYQYIKTLAEVVNVDFTDPTKRAEQVNEVFSRGLLAVTQQECIAGISGVPNKGMYFSEAQNWELDN
jgi:hypothetical protein